MLQFLFGRPGTGLFLFALAVGLYTRLYTTVIVSFLGGYNLLVVGDCANFASQKNHR